MSAARRYTMRALGVAIAACALLIAYLYGRVSAFDELGCTAENPCFTIERGQP
jgi:hypothetical protein